MYVIFEGVDTCGKSTQVSLFKQKNSDVIQTKEPGGTTLGYKLREILLESKESFSLRAELFLFLADRAEHYDSVVKPNKDKLIISDRGFVSGIAYALSNNPELDLEFLISLNKFALEGHFPEKIVLFETSAQLIQTRMNIKEKDTIEARGIEYLLDVQANMKKILEALHVKYLCVDAHQSIEEIYNQIKEYLDK